VQSGLGMYSPGALGYAPFAWWAHQCSWRVIPLRVFSHLARPVALRLRLGARRDGTVRVPSLAGCVSHVLRSQVVLRLYPEFG
jgi:hypothetical protein